MARKRASMREGPLAELFRATEAAQRRAEGGEGEPEQQQPQATPPPAEPETRHYEPLEETVEHVVQFEEPAPEPAALEPASDEVSQREEAAASEPPPVREPEPLRLVRVPAAPPFGG